MMQRRQFLKLSGLLAGGTILTLPNVTQGATFSGNTLVGLKKGDKVGVITPGSALSKDAFHEALANIASLGLKPIPAKYANKKYGFLGGTDFQRLSDLHEMFQRKDIKGIICARGGYGTGRLLPHIDFDLIKRNPKVFVGFSDITALLNAINKETGMICFHGPVGASELTEFTRKSLVDLVFNGDKFQLKASNGFTINKGTARGKLVGGNLTLINSLLGTPYEIKLNNKVLFIEEVGESPYRIDRMLTQLLNSGSLQKANGLVFGKFSGCDINPTDPDYTTKFKLREVLEERAYQAKIPCYFGFDFGHVNNNATLPVGMKVSFDANIGILKALKPAVRY